MFSECITLTIVMSFCCKILMFMVLLIILLIVGVVCVNYFGLISPETKAKLTNTVQSYTENIGKRDVCRVRKSWSISLIMIFFTVFVVLFLMGIMKGILGLWYSRQIGMFGLDVLLDLPHPISCYYEPELRHHKVVYDPEGWPVHPNCCERRVRIITETSEFCLNTTFFFTFPCIVLWVAIQSLCGKYDIDYKSSETERKCGSCDGDDQENKSLEVTEQCTNEETETNLKPSFVDKVCKSFTVNLKTSIDKFKNQISENKILSNLKIKIKSEISVPIIQVSKEEYLDGRDNFQKCLENNSIGYTSKDEQSVIGEIRTECRTQKKTIICKNQSVDCPSLNNIWLPLNYRDHYKDQAIECKCASKGRFRSCECKSRQRLIVRKSSKCLRKKKRSDNRICRPLNYGTVNQTSKSGYQSPLINSQTPHLYIPPTFRRPNYFQIPLYQSPINQSPVNQIPSPNYQTPTSNTYQSPTPNTYQSPTTNTYQNTPNTYQSPATNTYQSPKGNAYQTPCSAYQSPKCNSYRPPPCNTYQPPPCNAYQSPPCNAYQTPCKAYQTPRNSYQTDQKCQSNRSASPCHYQTPKYNNFEPEQNKYEKNCNLEQIQQKCRNIEQSQKCTNTEPLKISIHTKDMQTKQFQSNYLSHSKKHFFTNNKMETQNISCKPMYERKNFTTVKSRNNVTYELSKSEQDFSVNSESVISTKSCTDTSTNKSSIFGKTLCEPIVPVSPYTSSPNSAAMFETTTTNCDSLTSLLFFDPTLNVSSQNKQRGGGEIPTKDSEQDLIDKLDIYNENGSEEEDTKYVLDQLCISEYSLKQIAEHEGH